MSELNVCEDDRNLVLQNNFSYVSLSWGAMQLPKSFCVIYFSAAVQIHPSVAAYPEQEAGAYHS